MGAFLSTNSAVNKTFEKNQQYINEMNRLKVDEENANIRVLIDFLFFFCVKNSSKDGYNFMLR